MMVVVEEEERDVDVDQVEHFVNNFNSTWPTPESVMTCHNGSILVPPHRLTKVLVVVVVVKSNFIAIFLHSLPLSPTCVPS